MNRKKNNLTAIERRATIVKVLDTENQSELYYKELDTLNGKEVSRSSIKDDCESLNTQAGYSKYERIRDHKGGKIIKKIPADDTFIDCLKKDKRAKIDIAQFVSYLIIDSNQTLKKALDDTKKNETIKKTQYLETYKNIITRLQRLWSRSERNVLIDAGTTTYYLSKKIVKSQPLFHRCTLSHLIVTTNCLAILNELSGESVKFIVNSIGGKLNRERSTFKGTKALTTLKALSPSRFDIVILGAVFINIEKMCILADDSNDAAIKSLMLERSKIKIVVADSSKIGNYHINDYEEYAKISQSYVDIIVTNQPPLDADLNLFKSAVKKIKSTGVVVFVVDDYLPMLD